MHGLRLHAIQCKPGLRRKSPQNKSRCIALLLRSTFCSQCRPVSFSSAWADSAPVRAGWHNWPAASRVATTLLCATCCWANVCCLRLLVNAVCSNSANFRAFARCLSVRLAFRCLSFADSLDLFCCASVCSSVFFLAFYVLISPPSCLGNCAVKFRNSACLLLRELAHFSPSTLPILFIIICS